MIDIEKLKNELTSEQIISILDQLGANRFEDRGDYILFPTICHNLIADNAKLKLCYYKESKLFHCFTECSETFDIYKLFIKIYELHDTDYNFYKDILLRIINFGGINESLYDFDAFHYERLASKYKVKNRLVQLTPINEGILSIFSKEYPAEWLREGITKDAMDSYNILYSISQNKIIIPHYDIRDNLVGIRGRALNDFEVEAGVKYMPVKIEGKWYAHSLSLNLYGINVAKYDIEKTQKVILFEGEKSCLKYQSLFDDNISLATCGSGLNKMQIDLLIRNFKLKEIIIAYDKEYEKYNSIEGETYFYKLFNLGKKYKNYCNFSFIYDKENLIRKKDAPIDCGKDIFTHLLTKRIKI